MTMKKTIISSAIALGLSAGSIAFNTAQAGALATSVVELTNFTISHTGGPIVEASDFNSLNFTSTSDVSASLNGATSSDNENTSDASVNMDLYATPTSIPAPIYTDNDFTSSLFSSVNGDPHNGTFAIGDQFESGTPVNNLNGVLVPATLENMATVSIDTTGTGSATSNNGLEASFNFTPGFSGTLDFNYDITAYLETFLDSGMTHPTSASASFSVVFSIVDLGLGVLDPNRSKLDETFAFSVASNAPLANNLPQTLLGAGNLFNQHFTLTTDTLTSGRNYQLTARITTEADATAVPAPTVLALLGTGFLAMGAARKRTVK